MDCGWSFQMSVRHVPLAFSFYCHWIQNRFRSQATALPVSSCPQVKHCNDAQNPKNFNFDLYDHSNNSHDILLMVLPWKWTNRTVGRFLSRKSYIVDQTLCWLTVMSLTLLLASYLRKEHRTRKHGMCIVCYGSVSASGGPGAVDQYHHTGSQHSAGGWGECALRSMLSMTWEEWRCHWVVSGGE